MPIILRDARPDEVDAIAALMRESYIEYSRQMPVEAWQGYESNIVDVRSRLPDSQLIVAEVEGRLAAAITLYLPPHAQQFGWRKGWGGVRLLAVLPEFRGHQLGKRLMEECIRRCKEKGIKGLGLHTTEMMAAAKHLYEQMGFARAPEHDFHPAPGVTVMAFVKEIS